LAADAADKIASPLHHQKGELTCDFITKAMHSWILCLTERLFPGLDLEYNFISIPSLRARAYSMTAKNLAANALHWSQTSQYDCSFAAMLARLAESFLEAARREPTSSDLDLSTYFS